MSLSPLSPRNTGGVLTVQGAPDAGESITGIAHSCRRPSTSLHRGYWRETDGTLGYTSPSPNDCLVEPLTARELEVLALICEGCTNLEIGQRLAIGLTTVKYHTCNLFGKLRVGSRTQAVAVAITLRLVVPEWLAPALQRSTVPERLRATLAETMRDGSIVAAPNAPRQDPGQDTEPYGTPANVAAHSIPGDAGIDPAAPQATDHQERT